MIAVPAGRRGQGCIGGSPVALLRPDIIKQR